MTSPCVVVQSHRPPPTGRPSRSALGLSPLRGWWDAGAGERPPAAARTPPWCACSHMSGHVPRRRGALRGRSRAERSPTNLGRRRVGNRAPASDSQPLQQRAHRAYPVRTPEGVSDRCLSRSAPGSNRYYDIRYSPWAPFRAVTAGPLQHPIGAGGRHGPLAAARSDGSRPLISTPRPAYVVSGSPRPEIEHG
jgi:hypothetical protein